MTIAREIRNKTVSAVRNITVSFSGKLDDGELLTGTPTVTEVTTTDLTISNETASVGALVVNGVLTPTGEAVQFSVTGGSVGTYQITIAVNTDSLPAQLLYGTIKLKVVADNK